MEHAPTSKLKQLFQRTKHKVIESKEAKKARKRAAYLERRAIRRAVRRKLIKVGKHQSFWSKQKCKHPGCTNTVGVMTVGQIKQWCPEHNRKGRPARIRAALTR